MLLRMEEIFEKISLTMVDSDNKFKYFSKVFATKFHTILSLSLSSFSSPPKFYCTKDNLD